MQIALIIVWSIYLLFLIIMILGWHRSGLILDKKYFHKITVLVPFRNEEKNLKKLVESLANQKHPSFEVIMIDDHSDDGSLKTLHSMLSERDNFRIVELSGNKGKKAALTKGVELAEGEIIVTTDADCWAGTNWLVEINKRFANSQTQLVSGPVALVSDGSVFRNWQALEFSSLIGTGAALVNLGFPAMANGANLAYRKSAFEEVDGFEGTLATPSGDDEFLLRKIDQKFPKSIVFMKSRDAVVITNASSSWRSFMEQRRRWASKWKFNKRPTTMILALLIFLFHTSFIVSAVLSLIGVFSPTLFLMLWSAKLIMELLLISLFSNISKERIKPSVFLLSQIFYPFYALFFGLVSNFGNYEWKGRSYRV